MLRTTRAIALFVPLLAWLPGVAVCSMVASTVLVACQDESQPDYWIDRLDDPQFKARSIQRLEQFYEDAVTTAGKDVTKPGVVELINKIAEPLNNTYIRDYADLDEKVRVSLIKLIAALRDPRTTPALTKAFDEFGKTGRGAQDVRWASRAAGGMKLTAAAPVIIQAFGKLRASAPESQTVYRDLNEAMLQVADSSWTAELVAKLEPEIVRPSNEDPQPNKIDEYRNQLFWQTTAAQLLGEIGDAKAVEPLIKTLLDPTKVDVHATAILALVKIGPAAVERTVKLLRDEEPALAEYSIARTKKANNTADAPRDKPHVRMAAIILGTIGDKAASQAMVSVLAQTKHEENRAVIAGNLPKLPAAPEVTEAFKDAFESLSGNASVAGQSARVWLLADPVAQFLDPALIPWLIEQAQKAKGDQAQDIQREAVLGSIKLMTSEYVGQVRAAVNKYGSELEKDAFTKALDLVNSCKNDLNCYLTEIQKTSNQNNKNQFVGIKAGYMLAILGDSKTPPEIVKIMRSLENAAVRFVAVQAIDHLLPNGSKEIAAQLDEIVQSNVRAADKDMMAADKPLRDVQYRIRSRAK